MRSMRVPCFELGSEMSKGFQHGLKVLTIVLHSLGLGEAELEEAPRDTKSHTISYVPPPRSKPSAAATSLHVGVVRRQCEAAATSYGNPVHVPATAQAFISPELAYTLELSKHVDLARVHQVRAAHTAALCSLPAALSRPPEVAVPAEGRTHRAPGPPAHARSRERRALVGSGGRREHRASSTWTGRSGRSSALTSCPAAPPGPVGEPAGRPPPSAARWPAFLHDLDLRHRRRHEEERLVRREEGDCR